MISVQKFIFPGIVAGCLFLVFVTSVLASPNAVPESRTAAAGVVVLEAAAAYPQVETPAAKLLLPVVTAVAGQEVNEQPSAAQVVGEPVQAAAESAPTPEVKPEQAGPEQALQEEPRPTPARAIPEQPPAAAERAAPPENGCSLSDSYPDAVLQWCGLVETYSAQNGLDPSLVAALILQESGGNPQAYSRNGAVGLMQVMPRDGLAAGFMCINGPCFSARPSSDELFDPEFNISYGTRMLAGLIQKKGDVREALRAYGPQNMGYRYADLVLGIMDRYR